MVYNSNLIWFINGYIRECLFQMRQFSEQIFSQHLLINFVITRGLQPLMIYRNKLTCAVKKYIPGISSSGKDTFPDQEIKANTNALISIFNTFRHLSQRCLGASNSLIHGERQRRGRNQLFQLEYINHLECLAIFWTVFEIFGIFWNFLNFFEPS